LAKGRPAPISEVYTVGQCYLAVQLDLGTIFDLQLEVTATQCKQAILGVDGGGVKPKGLKQGPGFTVYKYAQRKYRMHHAYNLLGGHAKVFKNAECNSLTQGA
jgi:hypothetical protein